MKFLSGLKQKDLKGKVCLLRVDLNILDADLQSGGWRNNLRVQAVLPTIKFLIKNGAKVVLLSHRGRSQNTGNKKLSLKPFVKIYGKLLKQPVRFVDFFTILKYSKSIYEISGEIKNSKGKIFLLENLRFFKEEEKNDSKFAKQLAAMGDIYINDAFAVSHRSNASVAAIAKYLPSYAGLLLEKEIKNLDMAVKNGKRPFAFILGGSKISDKIGILENFADKVDYFLVGGGIAINLFMAQGLPIGDSICECDKIEFSKKVLKKYGKKIILPVDVTVDKKKILDIGPETVKIFSDIIKKAKTTAWNGPMGQIEIKKFREGSDGIVRAIMQSKAFTVIGGGETATLFKTRSGKRKTKNNLFISTGGGAMLEYLSGKKLPGIAALENTKILKR